MIYRILLFALLNFGALALGGLFTSNGVSSEWYTSLNKAPWTPPGWVFGAAWTTIMLLYSVYMATVWSVDENKKFLVGLYACQWVLNVSWNPIFFSAQSVASALVVITLLTFVVAAFLVRYWSAQRIQSLLIIPYLLWLLIATSLNAYILFYN